MNKKPVYHLQNDPRWGKLSYTITGDKTQTIGSSGCGPTCMSMIVCEWQDSTALPDYLCKLGKDNGFRTKDHGTDPGFFSWAAKKFDLDFEQTASIKKAVEALQQGALVVCSMGPGYFTTGGHYILAYDFDGTNILVNDPASKVRVKASINIFEAQCNLYLIFKKKAAKPAPQPAQTEEKHWGIVEQEKLVAKGLLDSVRAINEPVTWGEFAAMLNKTIDYVSANKK